MKLWKVCLFLILSTLLALTVNPWIWAQSGSGQNNSDDPGQKHQGSGDLFEFKKFGQDQNTLLLLDKQQRLVDSGMHSLHSDQKNLSENQEQNRQIIELLKDEQLQKAMGKLSDKGEKILTENPELQNPAAVMAAAFTLWYGRTIRLFKADDLTLESKFAARDRNGELGLRSPLLNGKVFYSSDQNVNVSLNRTISSIRTSAELKYSPRDQTINSQIRHRLAPNLDLSIGTSQTPGNNQNDNRAGVEYQINF